MVLIFKRVLFVKRPVTHKNLNSWKHATLVLGTQCRIKSDALVRLLDQLTWTYLISQSQPLKPLLKCRAHMSLSMVKQGADRIRYVCDGVCSKGRLCGKKSGSCEFFTSRKAGPPKGKCGLENSCCCKVRSYISQERKNNNQLVGDKFSVSKDQSIFDHSQKLS